MSTASSPAGSGLLHQFTGVAIGGRAVLIAGEPGSGKSSLALALIDRGAQLIGDDGVALRSEGGRLVAAPAPATRGLLEIRNIGLVNVAGMAMPVCEAAPVALLLRLDRQAPRYIETAVRETIAGIAIPAVALWPDSPVLALRAEWALASHGLVVA